MIFKYNGYTAGAGEVRILSFSQRETLLARGGIDFVTVTMVIEGFLKADTESAIATAIGNVESAFVASSSSDPTMYHADGSTASPHTIDASETRDGVHVSFEWLDKPGEYATGRTYKATFTGDIGSLATSSYILYQEQLAIVGNGGPRFAFSEPMSGLPLRQTVNTNTISRAVQSGVAIKFGEYPTAPAYITTAVPPDNPDDGLSFIAPQYKGGILRDYGIQWNFRFTAGSDIFSALRPSSA